jgi:hypothetical protein
MKYYLAFDIGCIECGERSDPIGVFKTKEEAKAAIQNYCDETCWGKEGRSGQHSEEIFEVEVPEA